VTYVLCHAPVDLNLYEGFFALKLASGKPDRPTLYISVCKPSVVIGGIGSKERCGGSNIIQLTIRPERNFVSLYGHTTGQRLSSERVDLNFLPSAMSNPS
jgi:hypothetical protein